MSKKPPSGRRTRRVFSSEFKAIAAQAALRQGKTMAQRCQQCELRLTPINDGKQQLLSRASEVFDNGAAADPVDLAPLQPGSASKRWSLLFKQRALRGGIVERRQMVDREHSLSIATQAKLLGMSGSYCVLLAQAHQLS